MSSRIKDSWKLSLNMQKKNKFYIIALLIIGFFTYHRWLSFNIFANGDWNFYFSNTLNSFPFNYVWTSLFELGSVNFTLWRLILVFPHSLFSNLGYAFNVSEKITIFWPTLIFANIFSFFLFKKILKSSLPAFIGSIVFNYNTYYLIIGGGFLIYAATPWVLASFLVFIKALETGKKYFYIISGLALFIAGSYDFRVAYMGVFILFFYSLYYFFFIKNLKISIEFLKNLFYSFITFFTFGFLNIYWVLPMLKLGSLTSNAVLDRGLFGNEFLNILYATTLFHPFWTGTRSEWFTVEPILSYFWFIPIFAFLGLWLNKKNKNVLFFGIIALLGIFLTKQVAIPFTGVYPWLFAHFIGFNAFREASKFYFLIALGYAVLIGSFISYIFENFKKVKVYFKYILTFFVALLFLWNIKPILTGEISGIYISRHIPNDYLIIKNFILKDKNYYRTLWIPSSSTWSIYTSSHPIISIASALSEYNYWINYINRLPINKYSEGQLMIKNLNLPLSNNLLDISSIKYVFVPIRDIANDADFFVFYGEPREYYISELNKLPYLHKINAGTKDIVVYENYGFRPHAYITKDIESINKNQVYKTVNFKYISPSQYQVSINNVKDPFYLNFSESFNSGWELRIGNFDWFSALINKNYFLQDKYHFQNNADLNSFYVNPNQVCKLQSNNAYDVGCFKNADGSYNISGTLYFKPQSYMYLGLIISVSALAAVFSYLAFVLSRHIYEKDI